MALNSTHPLFEAFIPDWRLLRHSYAGERVIKQHGTTYLPATPGQVLDGLNTNQPGDVSYQAYKTRAVFHDFVKEAVKTYIGMLHQKPPTIELPPQLEPLRESASITGESLEALLRRINEQQLVTGRLGLLLDLPMNPDPTNPLPYITLYIGEAVKNWDDSDDKVGRNNLGLAVLDETSFERLPDFLWVLREKVRVLMMVENVQPSPQQTDPDADGDIDATALNRTGTNDDQGGLGEATTEEANQLAPGEKVYKTGVFYIQDTNTLNQDMLVAPMIRGATLDEIPFVFVNSMDLVSQPDNPPLLGLAELALAIYRGEADYRQNLFMQSQDTLVVIGGLIENDDAEGVRVGAGARLDINLGGDAKYIGTQSEGLPEQRSALENDKKAAALKAGQLVQAASKVESGEALRTRFAAQTATLMGIALSGALGLESILKKAAKWMGADPEKVKVTPNLEFTDAESNAGDLVQMVTARTLGFPLSFESMHGVAVDRGLTEMSFEDEMDKIAEEDAGRAALHATLPTPGSQAPQAPGGPAGAPGAKPVQAGASAAAAA
jgi:hypothetical protein